MLISLSGPFDPPFERFGRPCWVQKQAYWHLAPSQASQGCVSLHVKEDVRERQPGGWDPDLPTTSAGASLPVECNPASFLPIYCTMFAGTRTLISATFRQNRHPSAVRLLAPRCNCWTVKRLGG